MAAEICLPQIQACAARFTRLLPSGEPDAGAGNMVVSDSLIKLEFKPVIVTGDETEVKNACGSVCINFKDCDRLKRVDVTLNVCTPDPYIGELLAGGVVLTDGEAVGYGFPRLNEAQCPNGVGVELWAKRILSGGAPDPDYPYAWWTMPRGYFQHDAHTFENGPNLPTFQGFLVESDMWFDGPTNDWPVASDRVAQWIPTDTLPETACGYQTVIAS